MSHSFPHYHQLDAMDCGPTCLRMVAKKRTAKIQKKVRFVSGYESVGKVPACLRERGNYGLILK